MKEHTIKTELVQQKKGINEAHNVPALDWGKDTSVRALVLKEAGITPQELGRLLKKAIGKAEEKLTAKETRIFAYQGRVYEVREIEAHDIQLSASKQIMELTGAFPSRFQDGGKAEMNVQINVNIPWTGPKEQDPNETTKTPKTEDTFNPPPNP